MDADTDPGGAPATLPGDALVLPVARGGLLVSRRLATFCGVDRADLPDLERVLAGQTSVSALPEPLLADLEAHGFFGAPRPPEAAYGSVQIQLTNECSLRCNYCCTHSGHARQGEISHAEASATLRAARDAMGAGAAVAILGGEPLLVPWAVDLGHEAVALGLDLTLFTNGIRLADPEVADRVAALGKSGAQIRVSLAGPTAALCDDHSGAPRYEAALAGIAALQARGFSPTVDLMLLPQDVAAVAREMPALRRRLGPTTLVTINLLYDSGRERGQHLFASRAELEAALDRIAFEGACAIPATQPTPLAHRREGCDCALGHSLHVRSDGALFTCFKMEERVGDLRTGTFADALASVRAAPHRAPDLPVCRDCPLATLCGGGCRSDNLRLTGDADVAPCGPWRVRVVSELLARDRPDVVDWPVHQQLAEARALGIEAPDRLVPVIPSRHLLET